MGGALESSGPHSLLWDQVVLISGGTAGLGAGIARAAAREGATVAVTGRRREPGEALAAELTAGGTKALFVQADVAGASLPMGKPGRSARSPSSSCSCCPTGPAWSPAR